MPDWAVNLTIGLAGALLGFIGGFFTKTISLKIKQKAQGNSNKQSVNVETNGKE